MKDKLRPWFELCRLPNTFTAMADPLAGALVAGAGLSSIHLIIPVVFAGALMYVGGIVLNDWYDYRKDLAERPHRPLPSGRVRRYQAIVLAAICLLLGVVLARYVGRDTGRVAMLLVVTIILYDVILKNIPIAPLLMGSCRSLNLLMGMTVVPLQASQAGVALRVYLVVAIGIYVTGLTLFARREAFFDQSQRLIGGAVAIYASILSLLPLCLLFPDQNCHSIGNVWLIVLLAWVGHALFKAVRKPGPENIQKAVKIAVLGIVVLDAGLVAVLAGIPHSVVVLVLLIPAFKLGKWLYST